MMRFAWPVCLMLCAAVPAPRTRNFHFEYKFAFQEYIESSQQVQIWIPLPHDDAFQQIRNLRIDANAPYELTRSATGNQMAHLKLDGPVTEKPSVTIRFDAARSEHLQSRLMGGERLISEEDPKILAQYLKPDRLVPIDGKIRQWAKEVVDQAHAHTDLEMGQAIYNHVVATVKYDKTGKGWGRGDIYYACEERRGNCTDFHAIFIGYARALGIPARFAIGFPLPADRGEGRIAGYHCWAEFYAKGIGWVPVDASEAAKNPEKRAYFFGAHDENRVEFSKNRDLILAPEQQGDPLNYFVYPYVEVEGKPVSTAGVEIRYKDLSPTQE
jgi:transglutaminase-like putative cysteine protease